MRELIQDYLDGGTKYKERDKEVTQINYLFELI